MKVKANRSIFLTFLFLVVFLTAFVSPDLARADFIRIRGTVVNVRQGPGTTYPVLFQAKQGDEFPLKKTEGLWCLVQLGEGKDAWVFAKLVDVVPGELPESSVSVTEAGPEEPSGTLLQKAIKPVFYFAILLFFLFLLRNRRRILQKIRTKLMEVSGYKREKPFRYDDRQPRDDTWEL